MNMNLTLAVKDLEITEHFYRDVIGFPAGEFSRHSEDEVFLFLNLENICLVFQHCSAFERQHPALYQNLSRTAWGAGVQLELGGVDLDQVERSVSRAGWPIIYELEDQEHQRRELWVQDPDGYLLVLNQDS